MGTVVQVEDFAEGTVYSNITMVDQGATLVAISGTIHDHRIRTTIASSLVFDAQNNPRWRNARICL
jgi:MoaF-like